MADFYSQMAGVVRDLVAPTSRGGLGQGKIELTRTETVDPVNPWDPPKKVERTITVNGAVKGVDNKLVSTEVGGTTILASDRVAITEVPSRPYQSGDVLSVDGKPVNILSVENIPAAGITAAVKFIIRG